ncbi:MAG: bifunctional transaldolase/phosoglucose isomerase [Bryobacteraceae bacterium]
MKPLDYVVSSSTAAAFEKKIAAWEAGGQVDRIWHRDASVWSNADEAKWLGWLTITGEQLKQTQRFAQFAEEVRAAGFKHGVLLGMGGSSLGPEVLRLSFGTAAGFPDFQILDSTDPGRVATIEAGIDIAKTLFIVASKSGSTLEPNVFHKYFFERAGRNGKQFVAITDPGSNMEKTAQEQGFWRIFYGLPSIGGRFSALSDFGMIPASAMGIDAARLLEGGEMMAQACRKPVRENPGAMLGLLLGALNEEGRDKITVIASPQIHDLGAWMEQLVAESTGKNGKALIPVDREPLAAPSSYGNDRVFVYQRLESSPNPEQDKADKAVDALAVAGHPVIHIPMSSAYDLGREFFRWEFATAVAGAVMGINPFDQPDVEASKIATKKLTSQYEATGALPAETVALEENGIRVYGKTSAKSLSSCVRELLATIQPGDYFALLGYIEMNDANERALEKMRVAVRDAKKVATCVGFGPRFLHSTGQAYKGGSNNGVFLQITADDARDLPVPGQTYTFSVVKAAQARGDMEVMQERGRRALRIHLTGGVEAGLEKLASAITHALQ